MDIPTWLIEVLRQFPIVVVTGFAFWYVERRTREKEIRLEVRYDRNWKDEAERQVKVREEMRQAHAAENKRVDELHRAALAAKDQQIAALTVEVRRIGSQVAALARKLHG